MPVGARRQAEIELIARSMNSEDRMVVRRSALVELEALGEISQVVLLSAEENAAVYELVERVVTIEALEKGKGWWFRAKRRMELTRQYFKPRRAA